MILKAKSLSKTYGNLQVLRKVSLDVAPGERVVIMGKSGEGKSTLLHLLGLLDRPTSGTVEICGFLPTPRGLPRLRGEHIGFVFQGFHLLEEKTALANILIPAQIGRQGTSPGSPAYARAEELLSDMGLLDRRNTPAKFLSGGEKQRVALARALINDPDLLLADEPSGNLDKGHAETIYRLLFDRARTLGKALVVVTHDERPLALADTVYTLSEGLLLRNVGDRPT